MENSLRSSSKRRLTASVEEITLVLSGLHILHERAYEENNLSLAIKVMRLIKLIKEKSKWEQKDEKTLIN